MKLVVQSLLIIGCLILFNCKEEQTSKALSEDTIAYVDEPHSFAKPNEAAITHLDLEISVDFDRSVISGTATYTIDNKNSETLVLDSKFLSIKEAKADGVKTSFKLGEHHEQLGQALGIDIKPTTRTVSITYETTSQTEALQWLSPQQTADKTNPFLFTQGQAILTRTWIPIQDSPQLRITYNAKVKVPPGLMAVMSAENPKERIKDGLYSFNMAQPISPYLMALAVGDFDYKAVSSRTGVYAEPSLLDKVQNEFSDMEKMVAAAEALYGTYAWDQFDVIVLPPSFPFGGMENPRLTFATPTVVAGDKSLTSLIAHELAHSWSGNLVTNATWNDFWLNEGFTVYFEMRIMEALYGKDRANMLALISRQDLEEELEGFKNNPEATMLKLDLEGKNPDDGMNSIAYDKGYLFLRTLEETVGRDRFDNFLKNYFTTHAFKTMTTERFVNYLNEHLLEPNAINFNTNEWIYNSGIPENQSIIRSDKFSAVEGLLETFIKTNAIDAEITQDWTPQEWVHFIRNFPIEMTIEQFAALDNTFNLTNSTNSYIAMVWYEQSVKHNYRGNDIDNTITEFLNRVGRRWYVSTIFKAFKNADRVDEALEIYKKSRSNYHSVTVNTIDAMLGYSE
ncbi:M1 family metallopeptidase [Ichthyenterobacterium sp. W332]|uniref:Aminopeptidase N n=1 Tax=Microcosmobacter mediterraneus TaxID=3075607 RepID=A0ABU2YLY7_9FLAO|nr:M1 family metallopeptidase [Ichthyenterobacterium sp. W332]MDT0559174.1 M1 family metallopeptidase [Ichthyenterobacterium sp. W332]